MPLKDERGKRMKRLICILLAALAAFSLTACQETPDEVIVVQKDSERMIEKAQSGEDNLEKENVPQTISHEFNRDKLNVTMDTVVDMPDNEMPIIQVQSADFTQEQADAFWDVLIGDTPMFLPGQKSRADIERQILNIEYILERETDSDTLAHFEKQLEIAKKEYETAPETADLIPADGQLEIQYVYGSDNDILTEYTGFRAYEDPENYFGKSFRVQNNYVNPIDGKPEIRGALMEYNTDLEDYQFYEEEVAIISDENAIPEEAENLTILPSEARIITEKLVSDTGVPFQAAKIKLMVNQNGEYAYLVDCQRVIDGIPCAIVSGLGVTYAEDADDYAAQWVYESFNVVVGNDGIITFRWNSPLTIGDLEASESAMLSFDNIMGIFEKMIPIMYEPESKDTQNNVTLHIDELRLELIRVLKENNIDKGIMIPVWRFYGVKTVSFTGNDGAEYTTFGERDCWLTVNAVDGSIIDLEKGY